MNLRSLLLSASFVCALAAPGMAQAPFNLDDGTGNAPTPPAPRAAVTLESAQADDLKALILDTLVENPDVLVQALTLINAKQVEVRAAIEERNARIRTIARNEIGVPVAGNPKGDVTIVVFSDYNCAECRAAGNAINEAIKADSGLRVVYRDMPVNGPESQQAAKAAIAANKQNRHKAFNDALLALDKDVTTQDVLKVALESGIDLNKLLVDQDKDDVTGLLEDTRQISTDFKFDGAPAFFIGTFVASGQPSLADLQGAIAQERERQSGEIVPAAQAEQDGETPTQ